jgi:hypothetical protein
MYHTSDGGFPFSLVFLFLFLYTQNFMKGGNTLF